MVRKLMAAVRSIVPRQSNSIAACKPAEGSKIKEKLLALTDSSLVSHSKVSAVDVAQSKLISVSKNPPRKYWMSKRTYEHSLNNSKMIYSEVCPGCNQVFEKAKDIDGRHSYALLVHSIEECEPYKELNLITECHECNYKFVNRTRYLKHESICHSNRPEWMTKSTYCKTHQEIDCMLVPCLGCGKELKKSRKTFCYRIQDYIHMMDECEDYKALDLISQCDRCGSKFVNPAGLLIHQRFSGCGKK